MELVYSPFAFASAASGLFTGFVTWKLSRRTEVPGSRLFALLLLSGTIWALTEAVILSTWDSGLKTLLAKVQYLAITATPTLWLFFAARYTGYARFLMRPGWIAAMSAVPLAAFVGALTNEWHRALWVRLDILRGGPYPMTDVAYGWLFYVLLAWAYLVFAASSVILLSALVRAPAERRVPLANALTLPFFPLALNFLYVTGSTAPVRVDITPIGFAVACVFLSVGLFRQQLFDVVPLARDTVLDALPDAVLVVDDRGQLLDANPTGRRLVATEPSALDRLLSHPNAQEIEMAGRFFEVSRTSVSGVATRARAVRLHDVTERRTVLLELRDAQERLQQSNRALETLASTDGLTGLTNRRAFFEALRHELLRAERGGRPFSLVMADLDFFKDLNDRFGHQIGDFALESVATDVKRTLRGNDVAARVGGEEFALILPETNAAGAYTLAERIRTLISRTRQRAGAEFQVTVSMGAATFRKGMTESELIAKADAALYQAKNEGRNRVVAAPEP